MSVSNGVIRVGRKGLRKFAIGEEDDPRKLDVFEVDVVVAFQQWIGIDDGFRLTEPDADRSIPTQDIPAYQLAAVKFLEELGGDTYTTKVTTAEALDFIARLREEYDKLAIFFRPKSQEERDSPATLGVELRFSAEES